MLKLQRISEVDATMTHGVRCSFCDKEPATGSDMIGGRSVFICDECIAACNDMLADESAASVDESDHVGESDGGDDESIPDEPRPKAVFFRLLTEGDVARLIGMDDFIDVMGDALRQFSSGEVTQPARTVLSVGTQGLFGLMPACIRTPPAIGAKLVTVFARNAAQDLPTHLATILVFSPETGALIAMMDGRYITEARTGAVSAVSARLLARDDAAVMAVLGSGVQARSHVEALEREFELSEVRVWSPTPEHQARFVDETQSRTKARLVGTESAERAVRGADLVVLVTSSPEPVVQNDWVKDGAHVMSVGACRPDQREMDPALTRRGRLFVDSRAAALLESGDVVMGIKEGRFAASHIIGELGDLLAGTVEGRRSSRDVTIFKSIGLAVEDVAAAALVYRRAVEQGVGVELEL